MAEFQDIPAWITLFLGLFSLAAAVGEFRSPGGWVKLLAELDRSFGLRFLTALVCVVMGATIYLVSPWRAGDWLSVAVSVLGGLWTAEGLLILAAGDRYIPLIAKLVARHTPFWTGFSAVFGAGAIFAALSRL